MKKLFKPFIIALFAIALISAPALACPDGNCTPTVNSDIGPRAEINGSITITPLYSDFQATVDGVIVAAPGNTDQYQALGTADANLRADAAASGKDSYERVWVRTGRHFWDGHYEDVLVPGESEAYGRSVLSLSSDVDVHTNGIQTNGLAYTAVKGTTTLDIDGNAWAEGTDGCLQTATIDTNGSLSAYAYGRSQSGSFNGSNSLPGAAAYGSGLTTVDFTGNEADSSNHDSLFGLLPNKASVDFDTTITVNQGLFTSSYLSEDGRTSANFAFVGGGSAQSALGVDESILGFNTDMDNISLTGIHASGKVGQYGLATDGNGAFAYGSSHAFFSGANGGVESIPGNTYCIPFVGHITEASPGQIANVGGFAVVNGYNNVSVQPNLITVTSVQHAYSTTGNSGHIAD
jgi:hypothetical protein